MVLLEDSGALVGLVLALTGVGLTMLTGNPVWDGVGTHRHRCAARRHRRRADGRDAQPADRRGCDTRTRTGRSGRRSKQTDNVDRLIHLRTQYLGPEELLVGAKIALAADDRPGHRGQRPSTRRKPRSVRRCPPPRSSTWNQISIGRRPDLAARFSASNSRMLCRIVRPTNCIDGTMYRLSSRLNRRRNHSARTGSVSAAPRNWSKSPPTGRYHHGIGPEAPCRTRSPIAFIVHTGYVDFAVALLNSRRGRRPVTRARGGDGPPAATSSSCPARRWG